MLKTFQSVVGSRGTLRLHASFRSWFVAAMTRTSAWTPATRHPHHLLLLDGRRSFDWIRRRHVPDLVEEDVPPSAFSTSPAWKRSPRERPLLVAKELDSRSVPDRGAVQREERPVGAGLRPWTPGRPSSFPSRFPRYQYVHPVERPGGSSVKTSSIGGRIRRSPRSRAACRPPRGALDLPAHPALLERLEDGGPQAGDLQRA